MCKDLKKEKKKIFQAWNLQAWKHRSNTCYCFFAGCLSGLFHRDVIGRFDGTAGRSTVGGVGFLGRTSRLVWSSITPLGWRCKKPTCTLQEKLQVLFGLINLDKFMKACLLRNLIRTEGRNTGTPIIFVNCNRKMTFESSWTCLAYF